MGVSLTFSLPNKPSQAQVQTDGSISLLSYKTCISLSNRNIKVIKQYLPLMSQGPYPQRSLSIHLIQPQNFIMVKKSSKVQSSPLNSEFFLWKTLRIYLCIYLLELDFLFTEERVNTFPITYEELALYQMLSICGCCFKCIMWIKSHIWYQSPYDVGN